MSKKLLTLVSIISLSTLLISCSNNQEEYDELKYINFNLEEENIKLKQDLKELERKYDDLRFFSNTESTDSSNSDNISTITLTNGTYEVGFGKDIAPGIYDIIAVSGYGKLKGDFASGFLSMGIGISDKYTDHAAYYNLELTTGDSFTISNGVTLRFE